jgi:hypothetical protein
MNHISNARESFFKHNHENERGSRQVTRSSAIYYFASRPDFRTQILFLNYWKEKRDIAVRMRLTLRSMDGLVVTVADWEIEAVGGHVIEIDNVLETLDVRPAEGSAEIEVFSDSNLAIAYPAAIVRYLGNSWHTVAHASQRAFSELSGDDVEAVGVAHVAEEGNLTIHEDPNLEPFVIIHNGPSAITAEPLEFMITASDGRSMSVATEALGWAPFQTRILRLADFAEYRPFLKEGFGTYSVRFLIGGIFPRLIGGNELSGTWSVDHTNFASVRGAAAADVIPVVGQAGFKDLVFNLPNNVAENWECFADVYPTYPDQNYSIERNLLDANGETLALEPILVAEGDSRPVVRLRVDNAELAPIGRNLELLFRHEKELPRRFHTGIHYRIGTGNPGFLTDGPLPHSTAPIRTRWFPVFETDECRNFLLAANRTIGDEQDTDISFRTRLFNIFGEAPLEGRFELAKRDSVCVSLEELFPDAIDFLRGGMGWIYMTADQPQRSVLHYASVRGGNSIAVCHAF